MASKVIIVTGASRGIGLAITEYLIGASHKVFLVSRSEEDLASIKKKSPSQVEYLAADLSDTQVAPKVTELAVKAFGKIDGLVVNHGVLTPMKRIGDSSIEEWKKIYDANLFSALALVQAALPHLRKTKGHVVFTSSGASLHAYASWGAYGSSKAAMNSLAQHIAVEEPNITAVAIGPGRVDTEMQREIREHGGSGNSMSEADYANFVAAFEGGKLNKPEWPGHVIAKLVLDTKPEIDGKYLSWNSAELAEYRDK